MRLTGATFLVAFGFFLSTFLPAPAFAQKIDRLDQHHLPLGDGHVSAEPRRGSVYSCQTHFSGNGGATNNVPWIHGTSWDLTEKLSVSGTVHWPQAQFSITLNTNGRTVSGNDLPADHDTGQFPISPNEPVYRIDRNPNSIRAQTLSFTLARDPVPTQTPSCVPMGIIGIALSGVAIFNALDDGGRDAVAHEAQDVCSGHPQPQGMYHYHGPSRCLPGTQANLTLVGYALDGFGIFSLYDAQGREVADADLDECHGRVDTILWDGRAVRMYHYTLTREYPYTVGCFRGTPLRIQQTGSRQDGPGRPNGPPNGPMGAFPPGAGPGMGQRPPPPPGGFGTPPFR